MKYRFKGLKEYVAKLEALSDPHNTKACVDNAVIEGSKVVEKMTLAELQKLPTDDSPSVKGEMRKGLRTYQKKDLIDSFGISPIDHKPNFTDVKSGVRKGTNRTGTPFVTTARSLEKGTSALKKNAVFTRASRKARKPCLEAMQESLNRDIRQIMEENEKRLRSNV